MTGWEFTPTAKTLMIEPVALVRPNGEQKILVCHAPVMSLPNAAFRPAKFADDPEAPELDQVVSDPANPTRQDPDVEMAAVRISEFPD